MTIMNMTGGGVKTEPEGWSGKVPIPGIGIGEIDDVNITATEHNYALLDVNRLISAEADGIYIVDASTGNKTKYNNYVITAPLDDAIETSTGFRLITTTATTSCTIWDITPEGATYNVVSFSGSTYVTTRIRFLNENLFLGGYSAEDRLYLFEIEGENVNRRTLWNANEWAVSVDRSACAYRFGSIMYTIDTETGSPINSQNVNSSSYITAFENDVYAINPNSANMVGTKNTVVQIPYLGGYVSSNPIQWNVEGGYGIPLNYPSGKTYAKLFIAYSNQSMWQWGLVPTVPGNSIGLDGNTYIYSNTT